MMQIVKESLFLTLVRLGIEKKTVNDSLLTVHVSNSIDWSTMKDLAEKQELSAVVLDGLNELRVKSGELRVNLQEKILLAEWIGEVHHFYEQRYEQYARAISSLAAFYNSHGFKMMVLKGYACSLDWQKPEHRPCGDIDIWQFGQQKEADAALEASFKIQDPSFKIDNSHHHHTVFYWRDFMVENHYDFVNTHDYQSSKELEVVFKELGRKDSFTAEVYGETVFLPSPNLHALFLIRHLVAHFTSTSVTLRQVLDWAFYVEKHTTEIDWKWLNVMIEMYQMKDFINCINAICVEDLGFDASIFPNVQFLPDLKEKVLNDILFPKYTANEPSRMIPRLVYKYRRWQGNAWKQELCYSESRWSAFWSGIYGHLLKPKSI